MTFERRRLAVLALLQDFKRDPAQSDLDAAIDRILAQREEISRLEKQLAALGATGPRIGFGAPRLRIVKGCAA